MPRPKMVKKYKKKESGFAMRKRVYGSAGKQLYRDLKFLKSVINVEYKYRDTSGDTTYSTTGSVNNLCLVAQGDDSIERNGRSIKLKYLQLRGVCEKHGSANWTRVRYILFKTRQNQESAPALTDLLTDVDIDSFYEQLNNQESFTILVDKTIVLDASQALSKMFQETIPIDTHVYYNGTTSSEASCGNGAVYLAILSNEATNTPTVTWNARIGFIDN